MLTKVPKQSYHYSPEHDAKVTLQVTAYGQRPRGIEASQGKKKGADGPCLRQIFSVGIATYARKTRGCGHDSPVLPTRSLRDWVILVTWPPTFLFLSTPFSPKKKKTWAVKQCFSIVRE
ncbi:hypothetical protein FG05_35017 [Fusarium graminearum]|nr:hypothetical protein FG05_35017 [Fusarium graminearum]